MSSRPVVSGTAAVSRPAASITLFNPLPSALAHYADALRATLSAGGAEVSLASTPSIELSGHGPVARVRAAVALAALRRRVGRSQAEDVVLSLWPTFGLAEPAWWPSSTSVWHVLHDPSPLRRQVGYGSVAAWAGRARTGVQDRVLVHSVVAADELVRRGWPRPTLVPHPIDISDPVVAPGAERDGALVLGQYKPARDLAALDLLAEQLSGRLRLDVRGRGWPPVPGWRVWPGFVAEGEFDRHLRGASCLVLPYRRYYVSGVAVRALEQLTPVVAPRHPMLEDLLGLDWPGFVEGQRWAEAVDRVQGLTVADLATVRASYAERSQAAWTELLDSGGVLARAGQR